MATVATETEEEFRKRIRKELVRKYAFDGQGNVTFVDFRRIHDELDHHLFMFRNQDV